VDPKAHHSECALSSEKKKLSRVQLNRMKCLHDHLSDVAIIMFDSELHIAADMLALFVVRAWKRVLDFSFNQVLVCLSQKSWVARKKDSGTSCFSH
jgi:hypothetical protein